MKVKVHALIRILLLTGVLSACICYDGIAQKKKQSRAARKAAEKAMQAKQSKAEYERILVAFENNRWAFETPQMVDDKGMPVIGESHPNVVGFNGDELEAIVMYRHEIRNFNSDQPDIRYQPVHYRGKVTRQEHYINKKGRLIYKYTVAPPLNGEVTVELTPDTPYGRVIISPRAGTLQYEGKFMPISECWYYIEVEQRRRKK